MDSTENEDASEITLPAFPCVDIQWNGSWSASRLPSPAPLHPTSLDFVPLPPPVCLAPLGESSIMPPSPNAYANCSQGEHGYPIPIGYASGQDNRAFVPLDRSFASPCMYSEYQWTPTGMGSCVPLHVTDQSNSVASFPPGYTLAGVQNTAPKPRATLHTHTITPASSSNLYGWINHHRASPRVEFILPADNSSASSSSSRSIGGAVNLVGDRRQPPFGIYRSSKKGSGCRRHQRASATSVDGLRIDEDDLSAITDSRSNTVCVHECKWAKSGDDPCGMWIMASRQRVGAHLRKWHRYQHAGGTSVCMWNGCGRRMLKDSMNRHVVTVHLGERFHCQGCDEEFSRKDVYDQHVENHEECRDAGAVTVYGTERKVISVHRDLRGGEVCYAGY